MDSQSADKFIAATSMTRMAATVALGVLAIFLLAAAMAEFKSIRFIGSGVTSSNTIYVSGEGEVFAVPDTATFSVTIQEEAKDVAAAQKVATQKSNDVIAYLREQGIEDKDIKTADYSVYPQYDYARATCADGYCPPGKQTLRGFQVTQTLAVKVRETDKAGNILSGVGTLGASSVSGLSFTIDDQKALEAEARGKAIDDARKKAEELAKQLGVELVRVVGFSEDGGGRYYAAKAVMAMDSAMGGAMNEMAPAPELPVGENKIMSNVNVTYEIR